MKFDFKKFVPKNFDLKKFIPDDDDIKEFASKTIDYAKHIPEKLRSLDRNKVQKYLLPSLMVFFSAVFLISAGVLAKKALDNHTQAKQNNYLAELVQQEQDQVQRPPISNGNSSYEEPLSAFVEITHPVTGKPVKVLREYASVYQLNSDMVGWLSIPSTKLNYPVVQTPDQGNYYLHRDFYDKTSRHGTIYAQAQADIQAPSDIVTLYGHNMNDGSMFASLHKYADKEHYDENPYIYFDTLYAHRTYQIISVFEIDITKVDFPYHTYVDTNAFSFQNYIDNCKELALYDTGVSAKYGDKLVALSTCDKDYSNDNLRFVIVAKLVS